MPDELVARIIAQEAVLRRILAHLSLSATSPREWLGLQLEAVERDLDSTLGGSKLARLATSSARAMIYGSQPRGQ